MDLYFDKENVESFISNRNNPLYWDCMKTIQKQLNTHFNFKKEDVEKNEQLTAWFKLLTSGLGKNNHQSFLGEKFPERPLKSNAYIHFNNIQLSSIFLISDEKLPLLKAKGAILIGEVGEEMQVFNQLFFQHEDYKFDKKIRIGGKDFKKWEQLGDFSFESTEILILDPYILLEKHLIEFNLIPYLRVLLKKSRCGVNIIIYTDYSKISITTPELKTLLIENIRPLTGVLPTFTLIKYRNQHGVKSFAEHDRTIFTNYCRVYSGDSFNYFKSTGDKLTNGREIHYNSLADLENHNLSLELIADIQGNLDLLPPESVEGDKKSSFLRFK